MKRTNFVVGAGLLGLVLLGSFVAVQMRSSAALCQFVHLVSPPGDLYVPIVLQQDLFGDRADQHVFSFTPRYCDVYEIGLLSNLAPLPFSFDPGVRLQARISSERGDLLAEIDSGSPIQVSRAGDGIGAGRIIYGSFEVSPRVESVSVEVQITKRPDSTSEADSHLGLYVGVSAFP